MKQLIETLKRNPCIKVSDYSVFHFEGSQTDFQAWDPATPPAIAAAITTTRKNMITINVGLEHPQIRRVFSSACSPSSRSGSMLDTRSGRGFRYHAECGVGEFSSSTSLT